MGTIIPRYIGSLSSNYNPLEWSEILNYLPSLIMMSMVFAFIGIWALKKDKENENNNK
ncbi:MAG: hypothetical protein U9R32_10645 [Bacteroidota bacterium]|nr:hypothetical protein [Bacteroidota bacterium]